MCMNFVDVKVCLGFSKSLVLIDWWIMCMFAYSLCNVFSEL